jgi:replicative DNA helicase
VKDARVTAINLQALAKELGVCVVALSQISNAMALQQSQEGVSSNYYQFRGSGSIKDAADLAVMLTRDRENLPDVLWLNVVKNRHDNLANIPCRFELETGRIRQLTDEEWQDVNPNGGRKSRRGISKAVTAVS